MTRLPLSPLAVGVVRLEAGAARYLSRVLRLRSGDALEVFDPKAGVSARAVVRVDGEQVELTVGETVPAPQRAPLVLVQGYPKGDKLADVVRDATEIGATLVIPALCARSVARPGEDRAAAKQARLAKVAEEAARQCGRAEAPVVLAPLPWAEAIAVARAHTDHGVVLWERATVPFAPSAGSLAVCIGPEGGLEPAEVEAAQAVGFVARSLGDTILRTETAATVSLGAAMVARAGSLYASPRSD